LTVEDNNAFSSYDYDVYIKTKKMSGIIDFMDEKFQDMVEESTMTF